jgi:hypothetical protein
MKTKNKGIVTVLGVLASSLFFIVAPTTANAGECSAADPCLTYAVLDSSNVVINIIICQPSVCGSGTFGNNRVVPQVAATPEGQNQSGYYNPVGSGREVTHSNGTFTMNNSVVTTVTDVVVSTTVDVVTNTTNTETSTVTVSRSAGNSSTFSYEDTIGKTPGDISFNSLPLSDNVSAIVSASEVTATYTKTESTTFPERKTAQEVSSILIERNLTLLQSKINRLLTLLEGWTK